MFLLILIDRGEQTIALVPAKCFRRTSAYFDALSLVSLSLLEYYIIPYKSFRASEYKSQSYHEKEENIKKKKKKQILHGYLCFFIIHYCIGKDVGKHRSAVESMRVMQIAAKLNAKKKEDTAYQRKTFLRPALRSVHRPRKLMQRTFIIKRVSLNLT